MDEIQSTWRFLNDDKKIELLKFNYDNLQNMIAFADTKANMSITLQSLFLTVGIGSPLLSDVFGHLKKIDNYYLRFCVYWVFIYLLLSSLIGLYYTMSVYRARPPKNQIEQNRKGIMYFNHIADYISAESFQNKVENICSNNVIEEFSQQIYALACIASIKMDLVNKSIIYLMLNIVTTVIFLGLCAIVLTLSS